MSDAENLLARAHAAAGSIGPAPPCGSTDLPGRDYFAWRWQSRGLARSLVPVTTIAGIRLRDLQCIDRQKDEIVRIKRVSVD